MKRDFTQDFSEITRLTNLIKEGRVNEAIELGEPDFDRFAGDEEMEDIPEPIDDQSPEMTDEIAEIREIALKGMLRLVKTPEDPNYEALKQIFSYTEKANKKKVEENQQ